MALLFLGPEFTALGFLIVSISQKKGGDLVVMIKPEPARTYLLLTRQELKYLEACIFVADGDGDQADRFQVDQVALGRMIQRKIEELG